MVNANMLEGWILLEKTDPIYNSVCHSKIMGFTPLKKNLKSEKLFEISPLPPLPETYSKSQHAPDPLSGRKVAPIGSNESLEISPPGSNESAGAAPATLSPTSKMSVSSVSFNVSAIQSQAHEVATAVSASCQQVFESCPPLPPPLIIRAQTPPMHSESSSKLESVSPPKPQTSPSLQGTTTSLTVSSNMISLNSQSAASTPRDVSSGIEPSEKEISLMAGAIDMQLIRVKAGASFTLEAIRDSYNVIVDANTLMKGYLSKKKITMSEEGKITFVRAIVKKAYEKVKRNHRDAIVHAPSSEEINETVKTLLSQAAKKESFAKEERHLPTQPTGLWSKERIAAETQLLKKMEQIKKDLVQSGCIEPGPASQDGVSGEEQSKAGSSTTLSGPVEGNCECFIS